MKVKKRLDVLLTEQGFADSRTKAQSIIMSGLVYVDGQKTDKPGISFEETVSIEVRGAACPYVSRGGLKLEKALRDFGIAPKDYVCSDSGASTGGFTDCLLQQGAKKVFAAFDNDRIMFATDSPWETPADTMAFIDKLGLSAEQKEKLFYKNAERLIDLSKND